MPAPRRRTIDRVNQQSFLPGDLIQFQGGASFRGNLNFGPPNEGIGSPNAPITITSYGTGTATILAGAGTGISIQDVQGIHIANLNITGSGLNTNVGYGILIFNDLPATPLSNYNIQNVDITGFGSNSGFGNGWGIWIAGVPSMIDNLSITDSKVHANGNGGIMIDVASNIHISHVSMYDNSGIANTAFGTGFGMFLGTITGATVERCDAYNNGWLPTSNGFGGGIGGIGCDHLILQYNESYANRSPKRMHGDGDGFFLDSTTNSIAQYNYSHDNDGAGFLFGPIDVPNSTFANNVIRYNISQNDSRRNSMAAILVEGNPGNAFGSEIYNNTIFMKPPVTGTTVGLLLFDNDTAVDVRNNIVQTTGGVPALVNPGPGPTAVFQGNGYWAGGSAFQILWGTTPYDSLVDWRNATSQEKLNGAAVGLEADPQLSNPGGGGTIGNPDLLANLTPYELKPTSPMLTAGLNLSALFGIDPGTHDLYGNVIPHGNGSIGADEPLTFIVAGFPSTVTAGTSGNITVTALDASGNVDPDYRGTVGFTSSDPRALLPSPYTFTAADNGVHTFSLTLKTAGSQSITVTNRAIPAQTGSQAGILVSPAPASRLKVSGFPSPTTAGVQGTITVTAKDAYGNIATDYRGTIHFTSSDANAILPANYTFSAADNGIRSFPVTLVTAGTQGITATDRLTGSITGSQTGIVVNPGSADRLVLTGSSSQPVGAPFSLTVSVVDAYGNLVTDYSDTVQFESSDPAAELPAEYSFTAADNGIHTFNDVIMGTPGVQTIALMDTSDGTTNGNLDIVVAQTQPSNELPS
jgi:hypothetical protein